MMHRFSRIVHRSFRSQVRRSKGRLISRTQGRKSVRYQGVHRLEILGMRLPRKSFRMLKRMLMSFQRSFQVPRRFKGIFPSLISKGNRYEVTKSHQRLLSQ